MTTNPLTYNTYVQQICTMAVVNYSTDASGVTVPDDVAMQNILPQMLNYAELRIQRDLDPFAANIGKSYSLTAGQFIISISQNDFQVIDSVSIVSGTTGIPLVPASRDFLQTVYNDSAPAFQGQPIYFLSLGGEAGTFIRVGPCPDQNYPISIVGKQWMTSLYSFSTGLGIGSTYISTNYPDLLIQASMVYLSQFQRNFLPTSNDPQMPGSFETQYQTLLKSAIEVENRKKFRDAVWSSESQSPVATPSR